MKTKTSFSITDRRQFLLNSLPAGILFCFGGSSLFLSAQSEKKPRDLSGKHKFLTDSGMTYEEVMAEYEITREDILAVLDYAAKTLSNEEIKAVG